MSEQHKYKTLNFSRLESPKLNFLKKNTLYTHVKELETTNYNLILTFKLVVLTEEQQEEFRSFLVSDSYNSNLLIFQKANRIDVNTGEFTQFKYGVCDDHSYIHEVYEHYLKHKNII